MFSEKAGQMSSKRTTIDKLDSAIEKILEEYGDNLREDVNSAVKAVTKKGVAAVKQGARSSFKGTGAYSKGWTSKFEEGRISAQGTIYNKDIPGLPHLLEHGHAKRNGGRVAGKIHIGNVEQEIVQKFEREVKEAIDSAGNK